MSSGDKLYLECYSGISGDMTVAALLDLGADEKVLTEALESLPVSGFRVEIKRVVKSGIDACDFNVILDAEHENHDHDSISMAMSMYMTTAMGTMTDMTTATKITAMTTATRITGTAAATKTMGMATAMRITGTAAATKTMGMTTATRITGTATATKITATAAPMRLCITATHMPTVIITMSTGAWRRYGRSSPGAP